MLKELAPRLPPTTASDRSVSVVVPSYDQAPFIERTLRSIFRQTLQPAELLVIDDGSHDASPEIIERVLKECPFKCDLIVRSNKGLSATLNEGLDRVSSSAYFAYLGSDDIWLPRFLEARVELLENRPSAVLAYGNGYSIDENDRIIDCSTEWAVYSDGDVRLMLLETVAPLSPTVVYRCSALDGHAWNERSRLEDYEMYLTLSAEGEFAFDPTILAAWRQHSYNISSDLDMMLREQLGAQQRTAHLFGLTENELDKFQHLVRFRKAQEMMRQGRKLEAALLGIRNLTSAKSANEVSRFLIGLLVPHGVLVRRRKRYRQRAFERYGTLTEGEGQKDLCEAASC